MLSRLGFGEKWVSWIKGCLESSSVSVLVNGSPSREFTPTRGLRQGDPIAPFLFLVVVEGLAGLVRKAVRLKKLEGVTVGVNQIEVSLLQFADDTLVVCQDTIQNVFTVKTILKCFELAAGLRVNFHKTKIGAIGVQAQQILVYAKMLNCAQMSIPFKYLGVLVGGNPRKVEFWKEVIDKVKRKLSTWKGKKLTLAGRVCLIKAVFTAIPLYYFSIFRAPVSVCKEITSLQRRFLWGWGSEGRKIAWIKWETCCKSKKEGGLGIKDVSSFNKALIAKWMWKVKVESAGKWREVVVSKYIEYGQRRCQSWWWRDLCIICEEGQTESWFNKQVSWKVGNGKDVRFWDDPWLGGVSLKQKYPRLHLISEDKEKRIHQVGLWEDSTWKWNLRWRRVFFEWEKDQLLQLETDLSEGVLQQGGQDRVVWNGEEGGVFSVKSAYCALVSLAPSERCQATELLWDIKVTPNALMLAWRIVKGKMPTRVNLHRRGIILPSLLCPLCNQSEESVTHLFGECTIAFKVWSMISTWVGLKTVYHKDLKQHLLHFTLCQFNAKRNRVWKGMWIAVLWSIWNRRNGVVFKERKVDAEEIFSLAQLQAWTWMRRKIKSFDFSFSD